MASAPNLNPKLTADEVNSLIYSYLNDSGFGHAAWSLFNEAHLDHSPFRGAALPRGELVSLLKKAVIFRDVEEMQQNKGKAKEVPGGASSLLGRYRPDESLLPPLPEPSTSYAKPITSVPPTTNGEPSANVAVLSSAKDKDDERPRKRARTGDTDEEVFEVLNPNSIKKDLAPRIKQSEIVPADGQPPGTMVLRGHEAEVFAVQWNPVMPDLLASGGKGGQVIIWRAPEPEPRDAPPKTEARSPLHSTVAVLRPPDLTTANKDLKDLTSMAWSRDGKLLAVGHQDATINIWTQNGQLRVSLNQHAAPVFDLAWNDDGTRLISAGLDGLAILWDTSRSSKTFAMWSHRGHESGTCCLDAEWLGQNHYATCGTDKRICIYNKDKLAPLRVFYGHHDEVNQIRLSPDGVLLASVSDDTSAMIWDVSEWSTDGWHPSKMAKWRSMGGVGTFKNKLSGGHAKPVSMVQWSPVKHEDGYNLLATFSREAKTACIWDVRQGTIVRMFNEFSYNVPITRDLFTHCFDPSGRFYALGGVRFLVIYSIKTGRPIWTWPFADSYVADLVWERGKEGRRLAVAKENGLTVVIDVARLGIEALMEHPTKMGLWQGGAVGPRRILGGNATGMNADVGAPGRPLGTPAPAAGAGASTSGGAKDPSGASGTEGTPSGSAGAIAAAAGAVDGAEPTSAITTAPS